MKTKNRLKTQLGLGIVCMILGSGSAIAAELVVVEGQARGPLNGDRQALRTKALENAKRVAGQNLGCAPAGSNDRSQLRLVSDEPRYTDGGGFTEDRASVRASFTLGKSNEDLFFTASTMISGPASLGRPALVQMLEAKLTDEARLDCGSLRAQSIGPSSITDFPDSDLDSGEIGLIISAPYECSANSKLKQVIGQTVYRTGGTSRCSQASPAMRPGLEKQATQNAEAQCHSSVLQISPWQDKVLTCFEYGQNVLSAQFQCAE